MTDAVEAARVALARTGTIIPKMGFGEDLEAAEHQLDACEAKLDSIITLGRTSAAATRRLGDAEKAGRRALAAAGAAADARVAAADAVWGAIAAVSYVRAAAAEDLLRAATAAHRRSTAVSDAVGAATAAFAAATTAAAAARLGARHVFAADAALEFEPAAVPASPEAPATPTAVVPESPEAPATPVDAEAETPAVIPGCIDAHFASGTLLRLLDPAKVEKHTNKSLYATKGMPLGPGEEEGSERSTLSTTERGMSQEPGARRRGYEAAAWVGSSWLKG